MNTDSAATGDKRQILKESLAACRNGFIAIAGFSFFINILILTLPLYTMQVFARVLMSRSTDTLILLTIIAAIALLVMAGLNTVRTSLMIRLSNWLDKRLGSVLLLASVNASLRYEKDPNIQGLRDLASLRNFLTGPGIFPILDAPWTPIFIIVIFILHPLLGWFSLIGAITLFALAIVNETMTRKLLQKAGGASMKAMIQAEAAARNAGAIEAMGMMPNIIRRWNGKNEESLALQVDVSSRSGALTAFSKFVRMFLQVGIMGIGAWLVIKGEFLPGSMIAASILMGRALAPVELAIGTWKNIIGARGSYGRIKELLARNPPRGGAITLPRPDGRLTLENVTFRYPGVKEPAVRGVKFSLEPGEALGLIGPSAAGKTTLAQLLVGILEPVIGSVRLDAADLAKWEADDRGQHIGYLPQDVELFSGKVRENIARMADGESEPVIKAARLAGAHEMVLGLAEGYETEIGHDGAVLSGGQRQRLALARALYGDPRLVVLDEPNASLDQSGETALLKAIETLKKKGVTLIIIAHRPNVLQHVDKILVLRNGAVQAFGPRDKIIARMSADAPLQKPRQKAPENP